VSKDAPTYQIGVAPHPLDGKPAALVFFESCDTVEEAKAMIQQIAEFMQQALGGDVERVQ
jgi:hypothetical protein